jgi:photosystem II stability/assembly factor-like uncharacterized protein
MKLQRDLIISHVLSGVLMATCITGNAAAANAFSDPLDTPSVMSERAVRTSLFGLAAADATHVVAVGRRGHLLRSSDDGRTWQQLASPVSVDLLAASFPSPTRGWVVGHDGVILRSNDGGATWQRALDGRSLAALLKSYYTPLASSDIAATREAAKDALRMAEEGPSKPFLSIGFSSEKEGWAIGPFNLILRTIDGGTSWTPWMEHTDNPSRYSLHAIHPVGDQLFIAGEMGLILRWQPASGKWEKVAVPYAGSWFGLTGNANTLVAFGLRGNAWRSTDLGTNWTQLKTGTSAAINAGAFLPDGTLVLASSQGEILLSTDAGESFQNTRPPGVRGIYDLLARGNNDVLVSGPQGVQRVTLQKSRP